ncbi:MULTISPECIES: hypothetical protein [unclassified Tolypothrix]|nr:MULTISPECIES: hypothetical protein [unclassified Tolypothrix]MBE9084109.1 hypothetical protein [Tolypothrix sp. LEGE 11397]UYD36457.1 hypothetical protein HG267_12345 [Tolypothrix sp. PCC 7601]
MRDKTVIAYNNVSIPNFRHKSLYFWRGIAFFKAAESGNSSPCLKIL